MTKLKIDLEDIDLEIKEIKKIKKKKVKKDATPEQYIGKDIITGERLYK